MHKSQFQAAWPAKSACFLIVLASLVAISGCGGGKAYSCVKVSGKVTYKDGTPIPAGLINVYFFSQTPPIDPRTPPHMGKAEVKGQGGQFDLATTFVHGDGIIVGDHKVTIQCIVNGNKEDKKLVPPEYQDKDKTPLKVNSSESPFDFKIPKPAGRKG